MQVVILCNAQLPPNFLMFHSHVDCPLIGLQAHSIESKHTIKVLNIFRIVEENSSCAYFLNHYGMRLKSYSIIHV